jgi:branched-chain amino acid transport system substrate-binding protein
VEKYSLTDVSVTPQTLRILAQKPDAVFIAASGPAGALPVSELRNRGYAGMIIHNQGIANPDFLRAAGRAAEGLVLSASPVTVAEQLPADHPLKPAALEFVRLYEGRHGAASRSQFGALAWDGYLLFARAAPKALATARPGTPEFRTALRDAMEREQNLAGAGGLYSMSPGNHNGTDGRSLVLITVRDGAWHLLK